MNEDVKSENLRIHSRADELIACLEGEIAKRDARIVELENAAESLRISRDYHHEQEVEYRRRWAGLYAAPVSEAKAHNRCLDEVARLNASPVQQVSVPDGWRRAVYMAEECLAGCLAAPDIARSLDTETVRKIIAQLQATRFSMLAAAPAAPAADAPPESCRQRLAAEGKPYPRSSCAACGQFSSKWRECDAALAAHRTQGAV